MSIVRFRLDITPERYLSYYQGRVSQVVATGKDGRRIQFPAQHLRPFVMHEGIHGYFELEFDAGHRFVALRRIGD